MKVTRSSLFLYVTQRRLVASYRRFFTTSPYHLQRSAWHLKMGRIAYYETSVTGYQPTLCDMSKYRRSDSRPGGSLKSLMDWVLSVQTSMTPPDSSVPDAKPEARVLNLVRVRVVHYAIPSTVWRSQSVVASGRLVFFSNERINRFVTQWRTFFCTKSEVVSSQASRGSWCQ
jgi:hypothetical protein